MRASSSFCTLVRTESRSMSLCVRTSNHAAPTLQARLRSGGMAETGPASGSEVRLKAVVLGAPGVGKTTLARAWARLPPPTLHLPTVGEEVLEIRLESKRDVILVVHDVGGKESEESAAKVLADADAVVLVYDFKRLPDTLGALSKVWLPRAKSVVGQDTAYLLVANRALETSPFDPAWALGPDENAVFDMLPPQRRDTMQVFNGLASVERLAEYTRCHLFDCAYRRPAALPVAAGGRKSDSSCVCPKCRLM